MRLTDFLATREAEIQREMADLRNELKQIRDAKAAIGGSYQESIVASNDSRKTIKSMVQQVLRSRPKGGTAEDIIDWIRKEFGIEVARPSLSPQLSRLKSEGILWLNSETKIWSLKDFPSNDEGSDNAEPSEDYGGGGVQGPGLASGRPEGANPSTSISDHQSREQLLAGTRLSSLYATPKPSQWG